MPSRDMSHLWAKLDEFIEQWRPLENRAEAESFAPFGVTPTALSEWRRMNAAHRDGDTDGASRDQLVRARHRVLFGEGDAR